MVQETLVCCEWERAFHPGDKLTPSCLHTSCKVERRLCLKAIWCGRSSHLDHHLPLLGQVPQSAWRWAGTFQTRAICPSNSVFSHPGCPCQAPYGRYNNDNEVSRNIPSTSLYCWLWFESGVDRKTETVKVFGCRRMQYSFDKLWFGLIVGLKLKELKWLIMGKEHPISTVWSQSWRLVNSKNKFSLNFVVNLSHKS